jgi:hypothetical protein
MNEKLLKNNYLIIPNFISPYKAHTLSKEFSEYCENGNLIYGDDTQAPKSYSEYNYISFLELLCEKTQEVSSILEETVLPTYAYARVYKNGSVLDRHVDRDACEISITVHLGGDKSYPIFIKTPNGEERSVELNPGDAMMYLGIVAEHWRESYTGENYCQVFLHYVRSRGECMYTYFDKNQNQFKNQKREDISTTNFVENKVEEKISPTLIIPKPDLKLEDFIHVFDSIVPIELCDDILSEYSNSTEWTGSEIGAENIENKNIRNCFSISLSSENTISKNYKMRKKIDDNIFECAKNVMEKYQDIHETFKINIDTGYDLLKYHEGNFYIEHTDSFKYQQRSVSCSFQLNDDYEGGEFAFFGRQMMIRSGKGSVIIFPSNFMYPHEIMPVTKGTRYSIITWFV